MAHCSMFLSPFTISCLQYLRSPIIQVPNGSVTAALKGPSKRLDASPGQVLFLWVRAKSAVVVTTTSKGERLKEYLQIGELGTLLVIIHSIITKET